MTLGTLFAIFLVGMLLLIAEIFVLPGFGIAGIAGVIALIAGVAIAWMEHGAAVGLSLAIASITLTGFLLYLFPKTRMGKKMVLDNNLEGAISQRDRSDLLGARGQTATALRPIGRALFGSEEVDVISGGEYIEANVEVVVVEIEGVRIVVQSVS